MLGLQSLTLMDSMYPRLLQKLLFMSTFYRDCRMFIRLVCNRILTIVGEIAAIGVQL